MTSWSASSSRACHRCGRTFESSMIANTCRPCAIARAIGPIATTQVPTLPPMASTASKTCPRKATSTCITTYQCGLVAATAGRPGTRLRLTHMRRRQPRATKRVAISSLPRSGLRSSRLNWLAALPFKCDNAKQPGHHGIWYGARFSWRYGPGKLGALDSPLLTTLCPHAYQQQRPAPETPKVQQLPTRGR